MVVKNSTTNQEEIESTGRTKPSSSSDSLVDTLLKAAAQSKNESQNQKKEIRALTAEVEKITQKASQLEKNVTSVQQSISDSSKQSIESLGIFVAFFTFISVEFQLFKIVESGVMAIAISSFLLGALLLFAGVIHLFFKQDEGGNASSAVVFVVSILLLTGSCFLFYTEKPTLKSEKNELELLSKQLDTYVASSSSLIDSLRVEQIELKTKNPYLK